MLKGIHKENERNYGVRESAKRESKKLIDLRSTEVGTKKKTDGR